MDPSDNQRNKGASSGSRSNDDDKGKKPVLEPPVSEAEPQVSTPDSPVGEDYLPFLLEYLVEQAEAEDGFTTDTLCKVLKKLGMSPEVEEDELCKMLKMSGYADQDVALDFDLFLVFADDFKLLESLRKYNASFPKGELDRGALGRFFGALEAGAVSGFMCHDFVAAFRELQMKLTDEDADSLVRYADLPRDDSISFAQFLKALSTDHGKIERRTASTLLFRRTLAIDTAQPLGRMMAFVSSYTRLARRKNLR